jgi:hypothetical protein
LGEYGQESGRLESSAEIRFNRTTPISLVVDPPHRLIRGRVNNTADADVADRAQTSAVENKAFGVHGKRNSVNLDASDLNGDNNEDRSTEGEMPDRIACEPFL